MSNGQANTILKRLVRWEIEYGARCDMAWKSVTIEHSGWLESNSPPLLFL